MEILKVKVDFKKPNSGSIYERSKIRVSDHSLEIESGRYKNITKEERICKNCNLNEIGDEYHFFLKCTANHSLRILYLNNNTPMWVKQIQIQTNKT
jgi:hypothetical protein